MNSLAICEDDVYMLEKLEEMAKCYKRAKVFVPVYGRMAPARS